MIGAREIYNYLPQGVWENEHYNKVAKEREKAEKERINKLLSDY